MLLASITEREYSEVTLLGMPEGWMRLLGLALLGSAAYAVIWLYRREARAGISLRLRAAMASLRIAVILLLALIWIEPVIATYTIRTLASSVLVLADTSGSMGIADGDDGPRIDQARALLTKDDGEWLRRLARRNELVLFTYGATPRRMAPPWGMSIDANTSAPATQPESFQLLAAEPRTDLGGAVAQAMTELADSPLAGIVIIGDGAINHGPGPAEIGALARRAKTPIYAVGVGSPTAPPNLRLSGLLAPATAAKGDPISIRVDVQAEGLSAASARVTLLARRVDAPEASERILGEQRVTLSEQQPETSLEFNAPSEEAGEFTLTARVTSEEPDAVTLDNERAASLVILDQTLRVLLVAGRPSYEYRFLLPLLERDRAIDVSCWLQSADPDAIRDGDTVLTELPQKAEDLFEYDVILLLDPDPRELSSGWAMSVRRLVDEFGGGLLLEAGSHYTSRFLRDPRLEELAGILPIVPDPDADVRMSEQGQSEVELMIPPTVAGHPLLSLSNDPQQNAAIWQALPGAWWRMPVLAEKPLSTVLLRAPARAGRQDAPVLFAVQPFGAGRVAFLACDTWRWRSTAEPAFNRFWVQALRYLSQARRQDSSKRGQVTLDRDNPQLGDFVKVEAQVLDRNFNPWHAEAMAGELLLPDGSVRPLELRAIVDREGWFAGRLAIDWTGAATLRVALPDPEGEDAELVKRLHVVAPDTELRTLRLHEETLKQLAEQTDGVYTPIAQAASIPDLIENASQTRRVEGPRRELWDNGWTLSLLAALLCLEWVLRRRNHLL